MSNHWKKLVIGGTLISAGFVSMFEMLIMDQTVFKELDETDAAFVGYLAIYNKQYSKIEEYKQRKAIFQQSLEIIQNQNLLQQNYVLGLNPMSDWTDDEYNSMLGLIPSGKMPEQQAKKDNSKSQQNSSNKKDSPKDNINSPTLLSIDQEEYQQRNLEQQSEEESTIAQQVYKNMRQALPSIEKPFLKTSKFGQYTNEFNWKNSNPSIITPVKQQGKNCASSYAFGVIAALEAAKALEKKQKASTLSEQQIIDCTFGNKYDNFGCTGGHYETSWNYAKKNPIYSDSVYPYTGQDNQFCQDKRKQLTAKQIESTFVLSDFKKIDSHSQTALRKALEDGPVAASIRAGNKVFRHYSGGVLDSPECNSLYETHEFDHAVLVVGYGKAVRGGEYFVIKNSFGEKWGSKGYAKISVSQMDNHQGVCGLYTDLYQAVIDQ